MHELERIEQALAGKDLDPTLFERCAQDLLIEIYPGLSPVPGGTDWGRDADLHDSSDSPPPRLMVTKSRDYSDIRANMIGGLESLGQHGVPFDRIVLANPGILQERDRARLRSEAADRGARLDAIYDRGFFASRLRRDGEWRSRLLGLSGDPITVSRVPWQLAESPWYELPLVGRQPILDAILGTAADVVLVGRPGVGKTRVVAAIPNAMFVDPDAAEDRLADDIRWLSPDVIVVDDVGQSPSLVRFIQRLRRQENDWLKIRLVVVCWPDETEGVRALVPGAAEIQVDLLERADMDAVIRAMGISGVLAREQILEQAEGRPAWAVALGDLLLRSGWEDLLTGRALLGQLDGYLRRSQLVASGRDLLAAVAALRGADERDLAKLAGHVGVSRPDAGRLLRAIAQGGLLDVEQARTPDGHIIRRYSVRPPMLADAVATEHYFLGDLPLGDIKELVDLWEERALDVALTVCTAARLGSDGARAGVDALVDGLIGQGLSPEDTGAILKAYLLIDKPAGSRVVAMLTAEFGGIDDATKAEGARLQPIAELAYMAAARYQDKSAVRLLLHLALHDVRATNPHPEHPLRKLADLCTQVHPDFQASIDGRMLVAEVMSEWLPDEPDENYWRVWAAVADGVLTPHARGAFTAPEDVRQFRIIETIVSPDHASAIQEQLWVRILDRLRTAPSNVVGHFVGQVHEWLRVGSGYDQPFGQGHPEEAMRQADAVGHAMLADLIELADGRPGLIARISGTALMFGIALPIELGQQVEQNPFFREVDQLGEWKDAFSELQTEIAAVVSGWENDPRSVVQRLVGLRKELTVAGHSWPDRVWMACEALASTADRDARSWVEESLAQGLFPEGTPFIERLIDHLPADGRGLVESCLANPGSRGATLATVLATSQDEGLLQLAVGALNEQDFGLLDTLMLRGQLRPEVQEMVLRGASRGSRAALAIAMSGRAVATVPDHLHQAWLNAVLEIEPGRLGRTAQYEFLRLMGALSSTEPDVLEELLRKRILEARPSDLFRALGYDVWQSLHVLPAANKKSLLVSISDAGTRHFVLQHLVGSDVEWLEELLVEEVITPEEALSVRGFYESIPIDRIASLLLPRGIEADRVAALAFSGGWTGDQSARYATLVSQFSAYGESDNPSIKAVGLAGVTMFSAARDAALARERQHRIRGDR